MSEEKHEKKLENGKPEVKYVPVEYIPHMQDDRGSVDLIALLEYVWGKRWKIFIVTGIFIIAGLFIALFSPVEYESEAILLPETQQQNSSVGQLLQRFGGVLGVGGGNYPEETGMISPMIYPQIVSSLSFQNELQKMEVRFADYGVTTTIADFYDNHYSRSITELCVEYTIGLPRKIVNLLKPEKEEITVVGDELAQFITISPKELKLIEKIRSRLSVDLDDETGLLKTNVRLHDPRAAAEINHAMIELLKEFSIEYRTEKAQKDLEFVEEQHAKAKEKFENAQIMLADFKDGNVSLTTARAQAELERYQDDKDLAFNLYNSLAQQLEQSRLKVQEQTPVFKVVQRVNIPTDKSHPKRGLILLISVFLGLISSITFLSAKYYLK